MLRLRTTCLVGCLFLASAPAGAEAQQTTTTCVERFGQLVCETKPKGNNAYWDAYNRARAASERDREQSLHRKVGQLMADGRCEEARGTALRSGDFALAEQVDRYCRPPSSQQ